MPHNFIRTSADTPIQDAAGRTTLPRCAPSTMASSCTCGSTTKLADVRVRPRRGGDIDGMMTDLGASC